MRQKGLFTRTVTFASFLISLTLMSQAPLAQASCGCSKPPPEPATVIPNVAVPGLPITLFHHSFQAGQQWDVVFESQTAESTVVVAHVVSKRDITDPTGATYTPQLVVDVPTLPVGPTRIIASTPHDSFYVSEESFTVIGEPVLLGTQPAKYKVKDYTTGVGYDGTLYISLGGITNICQAMDLEGVLRGYPLHFEDNDIVIWNFQGFLIDTVSLENVDHVWLEPQAGKKSDRLHYFRHSFETYCEDHLPGGEKEVDLDDPNWHLDGTPHVDYTTLIFALTGQFEDGSIPEAGSASFTLEMQTEAVEERL